MAERWTDAQRRGWGFMVAGASRGLTATESLEQYRAGGGRIATADWYEGFRAAFRMAGWRESIKDIPKTYYIPERMFELSPADWAEEFHLSAEMRYYDLDTRSWETKHVSTNMADIVTRADWEEAMKKAVKEIEESPDVDWDRGVTFSDFWAERRT